MKKLIDEKIEKGEEWDDSDLGIDKETMRATVVMTAISIALTIAFFGAIAAIIFWGIKSLLT